MALAPTVRANLVLLGTYPAIVAWLTAKEAALQCTVIGLVVLCSAHPALIVFLVVTKKTALSGHTFLDLRHESTCVLRYIPGKYWMLRGKVVIRVRLLHVTQLKVFRVAKGTLCSVVTWQPTIGAYLGITRLALTLLADRLLPAIGIR